MACGSEVKIERCISFGCVVEFFNSRCVCIVVLTGPVSPTLCFPACGTWLGVWFVEEALAFALIYIYIYIYTDDHGLSHSPCFMLHLCVMLYMFRAIIAHHQELGTVCAAVRCYKLCGSHNTHKCNVQRKRV
jgi:hypothetical protein